MTQPPRGDVVWQRVEGALVFLATVGLLAALAPPYGWLVMIAIFFAPDLSFLGYLLGPRIGSVAYNIVHIYGFGAIAGLLGLVVQADPLAVAGLLWVAHSGFDRMLGYGLKRPEGFRSTHLGPL